MLGIVVIHAKVWIYKVTFNRWVEFGFILKQGCRNIVNNLAEHLQDSTGVLCLVGFPGARQTHTGKWEQVQWKAANMVLNWNTGQMRVAQGSGFCSALIRKGKCVFCSGISWKGVGKVETSSQRMLAQTGTLVIPAVKRRKKITANTVIISLQDLSKLQDSLILGIKTFFCSLAVYSVFCIIDTGSITSVEKVIISCRAVTF